MAAGRLLLIRWSLATALTPFAAQMGLPALLVVRAMMGIGEGVAMPAMNNMLSRYELLSECMYGTRMKGMTCECGLLLDGHILSRTSLPCLILTTNPSLPVSIRWVPIKERSRSLALVYSGMFVGSILGLSLSPQVLHSGIHSLLGLDHHQS